MRQKSIRSTIASLFMLLSLSSTLALAESAAISDNLPLEVQLDLLKTELANYARVDDNEGIIELIPKIRALNMDIPDALYFLEARALYRTGQALKARDRLLAYLSKTGREGRYYDPATELLLAVKAEAGIQEQQMAEQERQRQAQLEKSAEKARSLRLREAQKTLQQIGYYNVEANGRFDRVTREALAVYQIRRDLEVNGDITDESMEKLKTEVPTTDTCDSLAAYARLPNQWSIPIADIPHIQAVPACNDALRRHPEVIRFQIQYARSLHAAGRTEEALAAALPASALNYPGADVLIGQMYEAGGFSSNGRPEYEEALRWYRKAAQQDYPESLLRLASFHENGQAGFKRSSAVALNYYMKAAQTGYPPALVALARKYVTGIGAKKNYEEAMRLNSLAAELNYAEAQFSLGEIYERGRGVKRDKATAIDWYRLASQQGHKEARQKLARLGG